MSSVSLRKLVLKLQDSPSSFAIDLKRKYVESFCPDITGDYTDDEYTRPTKRVCPGDPIKCTKNEYSIPARRVKGRESESSLSTFIAEVMTVARSNKKLLANEILMKATNSCLMSNVVGSSSDLFYSPLVNVGKRSRVEPSLVHPSEDVKYVGWIRWWSERTGVEPSICAFKSCANPRVANLVGGHVWAKDTELGLKTSRKVHYIVPICSDCNKPGKKDAPEWFEARKGSIFVPIQCACLNCKDWKSQRYN